MTFIEKLEEFYAGDGIEEIRLKKDGPHYIEYLTATKYMDKYISPGSKILDSCAGSGTYAVYLAERGHSVTAGDIVVRNVELINEKQRETGILAHVYQGDARDLSRFGDASFDAVLCMGALYHMPDRADREKSVEESLRVLSDGGVFISTYMNRHAVILNNSKGSLDNIDEILAFAQNGEEGVFYASTPEETMELMLSHGVEPLAHAALDGMTCFMSQTAQLLNKKGVERWRKYHFATCEIPSMLGYSYHNIFIGRKPGN